MTTFGDKLRDCRGRCRDPRYARSLSQERLGELLGAVLGDHGYSGQTISNWERGNSKPGADDRLVLVGLLTVLHNCGGLQFMGEGNELLTAGNYRPLDINERVQIFPGEQIEASDQAETVGQGQPSQSIQKSLLQRLLSPPAELQQSLERATDGPPPAWPRVLATLLRWCLEHVTPLGVLRAIGWFVIILLTHWAISPSLSWPFADPSRAREAMLLFAAASVIAPLCVGALTITRNNVYWAQHSLAKAAVLRLYTHQGAFIGFYLGYMVVFLTTLVGYYLNFNAMRLLTPLIGVLPIAASYAGARLVPFNLWQAYSRLHLQDGAIVFLFLLVGPLWGYFFSQYYPLFLTPILGLIFCLVVVCLMALLMVWQQRNTNAN